MLQQSRIRHITMSRKWGKLTEGSPGELEGYENSHLNELVKRAGGNVELTIEHPGYSAV